MDNKELCEDIACEVIANMLYKGKITADEAVALIESLYDKLPTNEK